MASAISSRSRIVFIGLLVTLSLFWSDALRAQGAAPLPDHVIQKFGNPPPVPDGPLSEELQSAVQVAFVESMSQSGWGRDQTEALLEISKSKDPRLVWMISDLMRFAARPELNAIFAIAASDLLGKDLRTQNAWGGRDRSSHCMGYSGTP